MRDAAGNAATFFRGWKMDQPEFLPLKKEIVYLTGILELLAVIGLLINSLSKITAVLLIIFFIAILPANIIGSMKQVNLGGMEMGVMYLIFRIPLQILFIFWAYYFGVTAFLPQPEAAEEWHPVATTIAKVIKHKSEYN